MEYNEDLCDKKEDIIEAKGEQQSQTSYLSKSKIIKNIGLWVLIAITFVLLYAIWKKKI